MLEQTLTGRIGMSVRLEGEFDLMLLPAIGVSGTELVIGGPEPGSEFARSHEFEISVALKPLLDRQVLRRVDQADRRINLPQTLFSHRPTLTDIDPAVGADSSANFVLPEIQELTIRDFQIIFADEDGDETRL